MNYYLDTEFHEYQKEFPVYDENGRGEPVQVSFEYVDTIELISIALKAEYGVYYEVCKEFDFDAAWNNDFIRDNVLKPIYIEQYLNHSPNSTINDVTEISKEEVQNVVNTIGKTRQEIKKGLFEFIDSRPLDRVEVLVDEDGNNSKNHYSKSKPTFYAYYADYDWVVFCWLFGRMIDLPKGFPMYCRDLKQMMDEAVEHVTGVKKESDRFDKELAKVKEMPTYPQNESEHSAVYDAKWNEELHKFLEDYKNGLYKYSEADTEVAKKLKPFQDAMWFSGIPEQQNPDAE